jgi:hypothetical protein
MGISAPIFVQKRFRDLAYSGEALIDNNYTFMRTAAKLIGLGAGAAILGIGLTAAAASTLFGGATTENGYAVLESSATVPFSGISFDDANGMTLADLATLSTDYNVTDDDCGGGSPRFQIRLDENNNGISDVGDGNVFVHIGPSPSFTDCATGWQSTGNLVGTTDTGRVDSSQVGGSTFGTWADAETAAGGLNILSISLVADGSWSAQATNGDGEQTIWVDNTNIDGMVYTYDSNPAVADDCRDGGWADFGFRNQGQCIRFVNTGQDSR